MVRVVRVVHVRTAYAQLTSLSDCWIQVAEIGADVGVSTYLDYCTVVHGTAPLTSSHANINMLVQLRFAATVTEDTYQMNSDAASVRQHHFLPSHRPRSILAKTYADYVKRR